MGQFNYVISRTVTSPTGSVNAVANPTGDVNLEAVWALTPAATNQSEPIAITQANIQAFCLLFTATGSVNGAVGGHATLKTNSSGSPQETITLTDGVPLIYYTGGLAANPFAGNVTGMFFTDVSTGSVGGTLTLKCLTNQ